MELIETLVSLSRVYNSNIKLIRRRMWEAISFKFTARYLLDSITYLNM